MEKQQKVSWLIVGHDGQVDGWSDGRTAGWSVQIQRCFFSLCEELFFLNQRFKARNVSANKNPLDAHESVHRVIITKTTNKMQLCRLIYYSLSALHVSGGVFAHHQEYLTVFTASGNIHQCRCRLVSWMRWNSTASMAPAGSDTGEYYQML